MALSELTINGLLELTLRNASTATPVPARRTVSFNGRQLSLPTLDVAIEFGSGSGQANKVYYAKRTLTAATGESLDLAGGLQDDYGTALTFTAVKLLLVAIDAPDGTKSVRVGPDNTANAWQGPFGGTGANVYTTVHDWQIVALETVAGYTVTAGTGDLLRIYNPGAGSVTYHIIIAGV